MCVTALFRMLFQFLQNIEAQEKFTSVHIMGTELVWIGS